MYSSTALIRHCALSYALKSPSRDSVTVPRAATGGTAYIPKAIKSGFTKFHRCKSFVAVGNTKTSVTEYSLGICISKGLCHIWASIHDVDLKYSCAQSKARSGKLYKTGHTGTISKKSKMLKVLSVTVAFVFVALVSSTNQADVNKAAACQPNEFRAPTVGVSRRCGFATATTIAAMARMSESAVRI